ncbi:MucBP domain-containing protein [Listeria monocytogenes]|uniref:LPXTG cell wall anchor domain-containing protein n=4 Tax=Listeria monocytogenes TaxID=1639 RepID=A0A5Y9ZDS7_LISMN|nr:MULTISPECIES: MucBP domain-containing protein [Listeria]EAE3727252.1 LPXTG cell wall anchor domain-containing protein [Listeria monocytogenes serotype 1/2b]EAF4532618.1 LPXTG cell wall anchor domain-containing protein [Listeria monocytogenes serotype 1/2a]EAG6350317.1 LPXTG cell wall anchor domain-containing protein [Listeria monocytogenes LIS0102]HAA0102895.1 LPXTG cell wall anchor domain-containing protein [Listeria monocytogenes CC70B]AAT03585.1 cell wall surface anchor family protein [L
MKKFVLIFICFLTLTTIVPWNTLETKAASTSWLEQELDGNEAFITETERVLSKNREDITLADLETIQELDIYGDASSIPDKISDYKNLNTLLALNGTISEIPTSITKLTKLTRINVDNNNFQEFPMILLQMPSLSSIEINRNKIKEIPSEITTLSPHLGSLDVRYNELITLPDNIFTTEWESKLSLLTTGNQLVSDIPADWLDNFNQADNMLEFYNNPPNDYHQKQDQLTYSGARIEVPLNTDLKTLTPDKTKLGLKSGRTLFEQHEFMYYDDGTSNNILTNGVATATGNGYITIKSTLSTNSNPFAKVRVPITVTPPVKGGDVTVQYKDTTGVVLADSITLSGNVGENYTTTAKTIDGYSLTTTPTNSNGTFSTNPQTVTYTYKKDPIAQPVTVNYIDTDGKTIAPTETLSGNVGENYTTTAKTIDGYSLTTTPANANGTFSTNPQTVTYTYTKDPIAQPVTVNYIDTDGKTIAPSETLTGNISENYTTTAKTIDGYSLTTTPANAKGTFSTEPQIINYIYAKNAETAQPITVNYRNSTGQKIAKSEVLTGNIGESYSTQPKTIAGYTLTTIPPNAKGTFTTNAQTVTYMYTPIAISALPVTVNYLDENGKEIADSVVLNGRVGEAYNTLAKEIDGYTLIKTPTNANGVFSAEAQSIDYIYRKNKPVVIVNPPIKNPIIKIDSSTNVIKEETSVLPKTGDSNPYNDFLAGILLLSSAMFLWKNHK